MRIFLDMDGVIADFVTASLSLHKRLDLLQKDKLCYNLNTEVGISQQEFWDKINPDIYGSVTFWRDVPTYPYTNDLWNILIQKYSANNIIITTQASEFPVMYGKLLWLQKNIHPYPTKIILDKDKSQYATPNSVLIDDCDDNVNEFVKMGGKAVLLPQKWNSKYNLVDCNVIGYIFDELDKI